MYLVSAMKNLWDYQLSTLQGRFFCYQLMKRNFNTKEESASRNVSGYAVFVFGKHYEKSQRFFNLTFQGKICVIN